MEQAEKKASKRLFVGIPIEPSESLEAAVKRTRISADRKGMEFYWSPPSNYHVTLFFLGATETERIPELEGLLAKIAAGSAPVKTSLKGMGGFPDLHHLRVLYVGIRKSRTMAVLQEKLAAELLAHGFGKEDERDFRPHLTIGRLRKNRSALDLVSPHVRTSFGDSVAYEFTLFESVVHGGHPVYLPLSQHALTGAIEQDADEMIPTPNDRSDEPAAPPTPRR
jgi:2'-5' RNA ligase